jgi:transcriptional regulator with GAF, ATPase, and Fis domain
MVDDYSKIDKIFSVISEVNEVLSLSNEPANLLDMVLDTLLELLKIDCCWVQLVRPENRCLQLAAHRGFTPDMEHEIGSIDLEHNVAYQVAVLGHRISISDLSRNRKYRLSSFSKAGLCSLVVVPLMTYRMQGVMGVASFSKKGFSAEIIELLMLIAGLVGTALNKADLYQSVLPRQKRLSIDAQLTAQSIPEDGDSRPHSKPELKETTTAETAIEGVIETREIRTFIPDEDAHLEWASQEGVKDVEEAVANTEKIDEATRLDSFEEHGRRMKIFRKSHMTVDSN